MDKQPSLFVTEKNFCLVATGMGLSYRSQLKIQSISKRSIFNNETRYFSCPRAQLETKMRPDFRQGAP